MFGLRTFNQSQARRSSGPPAVFSKGSLLDGFTLNWAASPTNLTPYVFSLTRASTGTYFDSAGLLQTAAIDVARGTYRWNGSAWVFDGTMIEQAATNLTPRSTKMADATAWGTNFTAATADQSTYLDGTSTMASLVPTAVLGLVSPYFYGYTNPGITVTANTEYVHSVDVKRKAGTMGLRVWWVVTGFTSGVLADFDLTSVTASTITTVGTGSSTGTPRIENMGGGIYRVSISGKLDAASTTGFLVVEATKAYQDGTVYTPNGTDGFYVAGAQVELGNAPTSRIVTAAASVTRAADVVTATTSGLLVNGQGFAAMKYRAITALQNNGGILSSYTGTGAVPLIEGSNNNIWILSGGAGVDLAIGSLPTSGNVGSVATTWSGTSATGAINGVVGTAKTILAMDLGATLRIGDHVSTLVAPQSMVLQSLRLGIVTASTERLGKLSL